MALIIETGSGSITSESYASVATMVTYAINKGLAFPGTDVPASEAALRRATSYVDFRYLLQYPGFRTNRRLQGLEWPRTGAFYYSPSYIGETPYFVDPNTFYPFDFIDAHVIPIEIINATCEAAAIEFATPGTLVARGISSGSASGEITKLKAGSVEIDYSATNLTTLTPNKPEAPVTAVLMPLLSRSSAYGAKAAR